MGILNKIAILGLGDSLRLFYKNDFDLSIGVNDIWRFIKTDVIVCLDHRNIFKPDRLRIIDESKPNAFYSQIVNWDNRSDFIKIELSQGYPEHQCKLNQVAFHKSFCSPFVACQIAFKYYQATEIHLFGVDLINHPYLNGNLCSRIKIHFTNLAKELRENNCKFIVHGEGILKNI